MRGRQSSMICFHYVCDFIITRFEHCNREANKVVHELARFDESLNEIVTILTNDVLVISNE